MNSNKRVTSLCHWASFFNFCSAASNDVIELITVEKLSKAIKLTTMEKTPWIRSLQKCTVDYCGKSKAISLQLGMVHSSY